MANEAIILELNENAEAKQYTCAAGTSISKGTCLKLSGDHTVIANDGTADVYAGTAAMDKDATNDTSTKISVHVPGSLNRFDMTCTGNGVTLGHKVVLSGANLIRDAVAAELLTGAVIGTAEETGGASEVISVLS